MEMQKEVGANGKAIIVDAYETDCLDDNTRIYNCYIKTAPGQEINFNSTDIDKIIGMLNNIKKG